MLGSSNYRMVASDYLGKPQPTSKYSANDDGNDDDDDKRILHEFIFLSRSVYIYEIIYVVF